MKFFQQWHNIQSLAWLTWRVQNHSLPEKSMDMWSMYRHIHLVCPILKIPCYCSYLNQPWFRSLQVSVGRLQQFTVTNLFSTKYYTEVYEVIGKTEVELQLICGPQPSQLHRFSSEKLFYCWTLFLVRVVWLLCVITALGNSTIHQHCYSPFS